MWSDISQLKGEVKLLRIFVTLARVVISETERVSQVYHKQKQLYIKEGRSTVRMNQAQINKMGDILAKEVPSSPTKGENNVAIKKYST